MKKRLLPLVLALALCLGLAAPALAEEAAYEEAIPCGLVNVGSFCEGLAWVETSDGFGFIDKTGKVVIPGKYDDVLDFSEGLAAVQKNEKWGFIDKTGKEVISCQYDFVSSFYEGLALAVVDGSKGGYIDKTGKEVIPFQYAGAKPFSEGLAAVEVNGKWGFIGKTGEEVIPCKYDDVSYFSDGLAAVAQDEKWGYIDKAGKEVIPCTYTGALDFSEGFAAVTLSGKGACYIDKTGEAVIPFIKECTFVGYFSEGLVLLAKDGKYGFFDKTGKEVIPCKYDDALGFSDGFAPVMQNGKWGYIDKTGKEAVPFVYDTASVVSDGMARVGQVPEVSGGGDDIPPICGYIVIKGGEEPAAATAQVSNWAKEIVDSAAANGLTFSGLGDDYRVNITRAQFAAVSVKLYEAMSGQTAPAAGDSPFTDTSDPAVIQAEALGFVGGVGNNKFDPDAPVTREQAAVMLSRVYTKLGGEIPAVDAAGFADDDAMSAYARSAIAFMSGKEVVGGVGSNKFNPKGSASIEQALAIALRMLENLK